MRNGGAQAAAGGRFEAVAEVVEALGTAADEGLYPITGFGSVDRPAKALANEHELVSDCAADASVEGLHAVFDAMLGCGDEFGGGGGGGGAQVGDEVRNAEVGLVADGGDNREARRRRWRGRGPRR